MNDEKVLRHTARVLSYIYRCVIQILKLNSELLLSSDVWLTVHRNSVWDKKPARCHFV